MKKYRYIGFLLSILLLPTIVFAYSNKVILGGQNIGIEVNTKGVLVVGFYKVNGVYNASRLLIGDYITKVNDKEVNTINELVKEIENNVIDNKITISYRRDNVDYTTILDLEYKDGVYKTGLYVKDTLLGNGTITYIDPESKIYGALGHNVVESTTNDRIELRTGNIFKSSISSITKSSDGNPGTINTKFYRNYIYGNIKSNSLVGIYGNYIEEIPSDTLIEIAKIDEVNLGKAKIYTTLANNEIKSYDINILKINKSSDIKNFYFEVIDKELLNKSGGIVQGMSGSPIVQNNKLIGAVTHVTIDNVKTGYGVSIITMLETGDKEIN